MHRVGGQGPGALWCRPSSCPEGLPSFGEATVPERVGHGDKHQTGPWGQRGPELGTVQVSVCLGKAFLGGRSGHSQGAGSKAGWGLGWVECALGTWWAAAWEVAGWSDLRFLARLPLGGVAVMALGKGTLPGGPCQGQQAEPHVGQKSQLSWQESSGAGGRGGEVTGHGERKGCPCVGARALDGSRACGGCGLGQAHKTPEVGVLTHQRAL